MDIQAIPAQKVLLAILVIYKKGQHIEGIRDTQDIRVQHTEVHKAHKDRKGMQIMGIPATRAQREAIVVSMIVKRDPIEAIQDTQVPPALR